MAYRFTGFLVPLLSTFEKSAELPADAIVRAIHVPLSGTGIALPSLGGKHPSAQELLALAEQLGIAVADSWLYIDYVTWGGIDAVYAFGSFQGQPFGPIDDSNLETVEMTYVEVMSCIGISKADALDFQPFNRGFWGD